MLDSLVHTFKSFCGVLAKRLAQRPIFLCLEKRFRRFEHRCERCFWSRWLLYWSPVASWERRPARKASVSRFGTRRQAESRPLSPWLGDVQYGCSEARLWVLFWPHLPLWLEQVLSLKQIGGQSPGGLREKWPIFTELDRCMLQPTEFSGTMALPKIQPPAKVSLTVLTAFPACANGRSCRRQIDECVSYYVFVEEKGASAALMHSPPLTTLHFLVFSLPAFFPAVFEGSRVLQTLSRKEPQILQS